jgi:predicted MFS family arabinose efflux permease
MRKVDAAVLTQVLGILLLLVMALSRSFAIAAIAALFRGMLANMGGPLISSFSMELVPAKERATINSVTEMAWSLGWAVSARVGGWMITRYSYELPYFFTSGLYLVCAGLYWSFFHKSKHNITLEHQESAISG